MVAHPEKVAIFTGNSCDSAKKLGLGNTFVERFLDGIKELTSPFPLVGGMPKGIQHDHGALYNGGAALVRNERPTEISGGITA
jgi:hypothetical protein